MTYKSSKLKLVKTLSPASIAHYLSNGYPHKCKNMHGHEYHFSIEVEGRDLDQYGMLVDFTDLKSICDDWIQKNWDHHTLIAAHQVKEPMYEQLKNLGMSLYVFPEGYTNTTAESMCRFLTLMFWEQLVNKYPNIYSLTVGVGETDTSWSYFTVCQ